MDNKCEIIKDLIPLYLDNCASDESADAINKHIDSCSECRNFLSMAKKEIDTKSSRDELSARIADSLKKQRRKKIIRRSLLFILIIGFAFVTVFACQKLFEYREYDNNTFMQYYGKDIYSELSEGCSEDDRETLKPVMKEIEEALNYKGDKKSAEKKFGVLAFYTFESASDYEKKENTKAVVNLLTAKLYHDTGYLWIEYGFPEYDEDGKAWGLIQSRITLVKYSQFDDEWTPVSIMEHP